jgi:hypothetical protein
MDFPLLLLVLLALPMAAAGLIVFVSVTRRRGSGRMSDRSSEPAHRLQSDSAAVQDVAVHAPAPAPPVESGRARRAASAETPEG